MTDHGPGKNESEDGQLKLVECFDAALPLLTMLAETQNSVSTTNVLTLVLVLRMLVFVLCQE